MTHKEILDLLEWLGLKGIKLASLQQVGGTYGWYTLDDIGAGGPHLNDLLDEYYAKRGPETIGDTPEVLYPGCELWETTHGRKFVLRAHNQHNWYYFEVGNPSQTSGYHTSRQEAQHGLRMFLESR